MATRQGACAKREEARITITSARISMVPQLRRERSGKGDPRYSGSSSSPKPRKRSASEVIGRVHQYVSIGWLSLGLIRVRQPLPALPFHRALLAVGGSERLRRMGLTWRTDRIRQ